MDVEGFVSLPIICSLPGQPLPEAISFNHPLVTYRNLVGMVDFMRKWKKGSNLILLILILHVKKSKIDVHEVLLHVGGFMYRSELRNSSVSLLYVGCIKLAKWFHPDISRIQWILLYKPNVRKQESLEYLVGMNSWRDSVMNHLCWVHPNSPSRKMIPIKSTSSRGGIM